MAIKLSSSQVLSYWQWYANIECLTKVSSQDCIEVSIEQDILKSENTEIQGEVWLSPFSFQDQADTIMPIWLPVFVDESGHIQPSKILPLPYVNTQYANPMHRQGSCIKKPELIDVALMQHFNEAESLVEVDWQNYFNKASALLEEILISQRPQSWQSFVYKPKSFVALEQPRPLFAKLLQLAQPESMKDTTASLAEYYGLLSNADLHRLTPNFIKTISQTMGLKANTLQTIQAPLASARREWVESLVLSLCANAWGKDMPVSVCVVSKESWLSFDKPQEGWQKQAEALIGESFKREEGLILALQSMWQSKNQFLAKAYQALQINQAECEQRQQAHKQSIAKMQAQDAALEQDFIHLSGALKQWRDVSNLSWFTRIKHLLTGYTRDMMRAEFIRKNQLNIKFDANRTLQDSIILAMRKIKVKRTKLHQGITKKSDALSSLEGILNTQQKLYTLHPELSEHQGMEAFAALLKKEQAMFKALLLCLPHINNNFHLDCISQENLNQASPRSYDWVIFTDSETLSPYAASQILNQSDRAVLLGDTHLPREFLVSDQMDALAIQHLGLVDDLDDLEDLQFHGHRLSQGALFDIARHHDAIQQWDHTGLVQTPAVRLNELYLPKGCVPYQQKILGKSTMCFASSDLNIVLINEAGVFDAQHWMNQPQADKALATFQEIPQEGCVLVTLSESQAAYMREKAGELGLNVEVTCLQNMRHRATHVIFTPVYNAQAPRPHYLDCGDKALYHLLSLAQQSLTIVSDPMIFDPKTHSPTGVLAKQLTQHDADMLATV